MFFVVNGFQNEVFFHGKRPGVNFAVGVFPLPVESVSFQSVCGSRQSINGPRKHLLRIEVAVFVTNGEITVRNEGDHLGIYVYDGGGVEPGEESKSFGREGGFHLFLFGGVLPYADAFGYSGIIRNFGPGVERIIIFHGFFHVCNAHIECDVTGNGICGKIHAPVV